MLSTEKHLQIHELKTSQPHNRKKVKRLEVIILLWAAATITIWPWGCHSFFAAQTNGMESLSWWL